MKKAVNFEVLKQLLAPDVAEGEDRYEFTWVGKRAAMAEAARPTSRTLRPVKADSGIGTPPGTSTSRETIWKC